MEMTIMNDRLYKLNARGLDALVFQNNYSIVKNKLKTTSVVLATDPEDWVRFPALPRFPEN
jgi:hypothetical protein